MKNLKKVLALVLAVAMMMGFATFASATDFTDDSDINQTEAIEVMEMIGVISGYPDGSFRPDGNVTRAQMAKMVATIVAGGDDVGSLYAGANTFSDCTTHWARGYIAYANTTGIIAGVGNGRFNPDGNVTGAEAAKMMLCALGYDQETEGYTGAGWSVNVLAKARTEGLLEGIEDTDMNAPLSRQNAARLMFNALEAKMVEYERGSITVEGGGSTVTIGGSEATYIREGADDSLVYNFLQLYEQYFPELQQLNADEVEDMERPSHTWAYKGEEVGPYVDEPDFLYTAETATRTVQGDLRNYNIPGAYVVSTDGAVMNDGTAIRSGSSLRDAEDIADLTTYGGPVEVYTELRYNVSTNTQYRQVTKVIVIQPKTGTLAIREYAETSSHGAYDLYSVGGKTGRIYTTVVDEVADVNDVVLHGNVASGDVVTYYIDMQDNLHIAPTTEMSGVLSAVGKENTDALTIGDETYYKSIAADGDFDVSKSEQTFALDEYGYVVKTVTGATSSRYGMILDGVTAFTFDDGAANDTTGTISPAIVIANSDGTVETIVVKSFNGNSTGTDAIVSAIDAAAGRLIKYTADGSKYEVVTVGDYSSAYEDVAALTEIEANESALSLKTAAAKTKVASTNTLYVFANYDSDGKITTTVTTVTGYNNVSDYTFSGIGAWAIDTNSTLDGVANVVFIGENVSAVGTDDFVYVKGTSYDTVDGVAYDVIIKGEEDSLVAEGLSAYGIGADGTMFEEIKTSGGEVTSAVKATRYDSIRNFGGVVSVTRGSSVNTYKVADTAPVYFIDLSSKEPGATMTAADLGTDTWDVSSDGGVYVSLNDKNEVLAIYILEK